MKLNISKIQAVFAKNRLVKIFLMLIITASLVGNMVLGINLRSSWMATSKLWEENSKITADRNTIAHELEDVKSQDQVTINTDLKKEIADITKSYTGVVSSYENILELKSKGVKTQTLDDLFTSILVLLAKRDYTKANEEIGNLNLKIKEEEGKLAIAVVIPANVPVSSSPPGSGYSRQSVQTDIGSYMVSIVAADLGNTKVIVDTASDGDCGNNCPVLPLASFVARSGAFAGVNGSYFCPASYPSCAGKTNTFDLLVMNKNKTYFNSGNNVYSSNPAVIFGGGYIRFVGAASEWGRDTGVDGVLSNYPLLVSGGVVRFGGDDDPKKGSKGNRSFVANRGNTVYIGVVHSATVAEAARVMKAMGMENALNLDDGGSTALWSGGYKIGPGRDLPNVILFVRK